MAAVLPATLFGQAVAKHHEHPTHKGHGDERDEVAGEDGARNVGGMGPGSTFAG